MSHSEWWSGDLDDRIGHGMKATDKLDQLCEVLNRLKSLTKQYKASLWNDEYRALAHIIHSETRNHFYVGWEKDLT